MGDFKMAEDIFPRVNFYDGQEISEDELDTEQAAWLGSLAALSC